MIPADPEMASPSMHKTGAVICPLSFLVDRMCGPGM
jgi:hypothetical protein